MLKRSLPFAVFIAILFSIAVIQTTIAQEFVTPGANANLIGSTPNPDQTHNIPDTGLKQQQEPSCIVRPSNSSVIMCAYNDLRASDKPLIQGDSWIGYSISGDKGFTWSSNLVPGFKSHPNSLMMGFAADPTLVAIPGSYVTPDDPTSQSAPGLAVLNYIGANRGSNVGVLVAQRFVENSQEDQQFYLPEDAFHVIADGSSGRFIDKPSFLFIPDDLNKQSYREETISVEGRDILVRTPTGTLIVAYAVFTGSSSIKVLMQKSTDNGVTWDHASKLSEGQNEVTGVSLTAIGQRVVASWRRKGDSNNGDAILSAYSNNAGKNWTKGAVVFDLCPFDQPATGVSFRTFTFPWSANDGNRFWTFATDRRFDAMGGESTSCDAIAELPGTFDGIPRIVGMSSVDGVNWFGDAINSDQAFVVDANLIDGKPIGYQVMPSATGTKGRIDLAWYDTRREEVWGDLPAQGDGSPEQQYPLIYDYTSTDATSIAKVLRKADVWMTRLTADCGSGGGCTPLVENPVRVSQYPVAFVDNENSPFSLPFEVEAHLPNHRLYASGTLAFKGDYIAIATPQLRANQQGGWLPNSYPEQSSDLSTFTAAEDVFVAWGDNRDVRIDYNYLISQGEPEQVPYTPPGGPSGNATAFEVGEMKGGASEPLVEVKAELQAVTESDDSDDPNTPADNLLVCGVGQDFSRSRDSNIYGSVVTDAPTLVARTPKKPLGTIQRMFPLELNNPDSANDKNFCLVIKNQPTAGRASFYQLPAVPPFAANPAPLTRLPVTVPAGGTSSRAVFVFADQSDSIRVDAYEDDSLLEDCADNLFATEFSGTLQNSIFVSDGSLFDSAFCDANPNSAACLPTAIQETHNISLESLNLQAPVMKASVTQALNLQALNLQAPVLGALNLQALNLQAPNLQAAILEALNLQALNLEALNLQALNLQAPNLQALNLQAPNLQALNLQAPNLQALNLQALNLQALNLQAPNLQAPSLGDGNDDQSPTIQLEEAVVANDVYYQDITYIVKTNSNVTTTYSADIALDVNSVKSNPDDEDPVVQLIAWTPNNVNSASTVDDGCGIAQPGFQAQVISSVTLDALNLQAVTLPQTTSPSDQNPYIGEISFTGKPDQNIALTARFWATGGTKLKLEDIFLDWVSCMESAEAQTDPAACGKAGLGGLISFGVSAQGCLTADTDPALNDLYGKEDCLDNNHEKIYEDRQSPILGPLSDITAPATSTSGAAVTWSPIFAQDNLDGPIAADCTVLSGDLFPIGSTLVECFAVDSSGNDSAASFTVIVEDTVPPILSLPGNITDEATMPAGAAVSFSATATDNVGNASVDCSANSGDAFSLGTTTVSCTATDSVGNTSSGSFSVLIQDTTAPTLSLPGDFLEEAANADGLAISFSATATDAVSNPTVSCSANSGHIFPIGPTTVNCTASELTGSATASGSFSVTVTDSTAPGILIGVPSPVTPDATSPAGAPYSWGPVTALDSVAGTLTAICASTDGLTSGSLFPLNQVTTVICIATDSYSNSSTASFTVTVTDQSPPVLPALPDQTIQADSTAGTAVFWSETAVDIVGENVTMICMPASGSTFDIGGPTPVGCSATDVAGNQSSAAFNVTVEDTTVPVIDPVTVPDNLNPSSPYPFTLANDANTVTITWPVSVTDADPNIAIGCKIGDVDLEMVGGTPGVPGVPIFTGDQIVATFSYDFPVGETTVICTAEDTDNPPPTTIEFTISVLDVTPPSAPDGPVEILSGIEATSPAGATVTWAPLLADDAVSGPIPADCSPESGFVFPIDTTNVICSATDEAGLEGPEINFDVEVVDTTSPSLLGIPSTTDEVSAGADGTAPYNVYFGISATDVGDLTPTLTCSPAGPLPFGLNEITCSATDATGNTSSDNYFVNVKDDIGPVITLIGPASITLEAGIDAYTELNATASDNVDNDITSDIVISGTVNTALVGTYVIRYNVKDKQGNSAETVKRTIIVQDTIAPIISVPTAPLVFTNDEEPFAVDFSGLVSVTDAAYQNLTATCEPISGSDFYRGDTIVTCNATDGSTNAANSATFTVTLRYLNDIKLILPKGRARAGSTIPIDWQYLDWISNQPVDSSNVDVVASWAKMTDGSCTVRDLSLPEESSGLGNDSGNSDFRYSQSSDTWQFSWQTPDVPGYYKITISPSGKNVRNAWECVSLK
jgi:uncharacterized protein YjbI with pentapeptide repeats